MAKVKATAVKVVPNLDPNESTYPEIRGRIVYVNLFETPTSGGKPFVDVDYDIQMNISSTSILTL